MKKHQKRSRVSNEAEEGKVLSILMEAFGSVSLEEAASAYKEANGDADRAAEILSKAAEDGSSSSSSGEIIRLKNKQQPKMKKVIASAGTVSTLLGKDYVRSIPPQKKVSSSENWTKEEAEHFLFSMLGQDCQLGLNVVSDVLCQCAYDLEKALDILLELSSSAKEQVSDWFWSAPAISEDAEYILESNSLTDRTSDTTSHSLEIELQDNVLFRGNPFSGPSKVSSESQLSKTRKPESELPQKVLESLFNMPTPQSAEHEPNSMNWRNIVKQMTSLGQRFEPGDSKEWQSLHAKGEEYQVLRTNAKQHWESMKSYYQKAATAYSNGEKEYAGYLSEQGRQQSKMAREADEKASQDIFSARNRSIENVITIDLHGQHIEQAMRLLKLHLLFGAYVRSVRLFRVITGCGSHGVGKSKLKTSVTNLLKKEGVEWTEENRGTLLIRLNGQTDFSFLDSVSDAE